MRKRVSICLCLRMFACVSKHVSVCVCQRSQHHDMSGIEIFALHCIFECAIFNLLNYFEVNTQYFRIGLDSQRKSHAKLYVHQQCSSQTSEPCCVMCMSKSGLLRGRAVLSLNGIQQLPSLNLLSVAVLTLNM